jgi:hypothetical protein
MMQLKPQGLSESFSSDHYEICLLIHIKFLFAFTHIKTEHNLI